MQEESTEIVKLNVGGKKFYTTKSTLLKGEKNFFHALLGGAFKTVLDENDRNGVYFKYILEYLRSNQWLCPKDLEKALVSEARFYGIEPNLYSSVTDMYLREKLDKKQQDIGTVDQPEKLTTLIDHICRSLSTAVGEGAKPPIYSCSFFTSKKTIASRYNSVCQKHPNVPKLLSIEQIASDLKFDDPDRIFDDDLLAIAWNENFVKYLQEECKLTVKSKRDVIYLQWDYRYQHSVTYTSETNDIWKITEKLYETIQFFWNEA